MKEKLVTIDFKVKLRNDNNKKNRILPIGQTIENGDCPIFINGTAQNSIPCYLTNMLSEIIEEGEYTAIVGNLKKSTKGVYYFTPSNITLFLNIFKRQDLVK